MPEDRRSFRRGFRPPWWPEDEPFPPHGGMPPWRSGGPPWAGQWPDVRRRFVRRFLVGVIVFFGLLFGASALAAALISGSVGPRGRGFVPGIALLALLLLFVFGVISRAVRRMGVPLGDVMGAAERVSSGDYSARVDERGVPEMRRLARSFNAMTERLQENEEQRRNLLADVAHELRTPLSVIRGNAEGILDGLYPADREHLDPLLEETRVMSRLLEDLQTLSTAEAGAIRLHRVRTDPAELVADAVTSFGPQADAAGIALRRNAVEGLGPIDVDPVRIGEVLSNLLANAIRHTPSGGTVSVSAEAVDAGRSVAFAVEDSGPGIAPNDLPYVFDRFVRSKDSGGAGLGLAIARSLVEAHGGTISAESPPGGGARIRFVIPTA